MTNALSRPTVLFVFGLFTFFVLGNGLTAYGQPAAPDPPKFFLETITVENTESVSPEIVISESLLGQGVAYTESQLRAAVHRITRLPFILDADFRLEKGSERNSYELVITVQETRKWFFGLDGVYTHEEGALRDSDEDLVSITRELAGRRFSIGKYGVLFAAFASDDDVLSLGYTHYNLADRGIILDLSYALDSLSSFSDAHRLRSRVIVPLRTNQSLRFGASYVFEKDRSERPFFEGRFEDFGDRESWETEVAWTFNSLDDPIFPTAGLLAEGGLVYSNASQDFFSRLIEEGDLVFERQERAKSDTYGIQVQARNYWPVARRHTLSAGFASSLLHTESSNPLSELFRQEGDSWRNEVTLGHSMFLLSQRRKDTWRELRWETELGTTFHDQGLNRGGDFTSTALSTGLAYRNGWGVFRLTLQYRDVAL